MCLHQSNINTRMHHLQLWPNTQHTMLSHQPWAQFTHRNIIICFPLLRALTSQPQTDSHTIQYLRACTRLNLICLPSTIAVLSSLCPILTPTACLHLMHHQRCISRQPCTFKQAHILNPIGTPRPPVPTSLRPILLLCPLYLLHSTIPTNHIDTIQKLLWILAHL